MNRKFVLALSLLTIVSCAKKDEEQSANIQETSAQQIGDVMASIDESGGSTGGYAMMSREQKNFARIAPELAEKKSFAQLFLPKAQAASCYLTNTWGSCTNNVIVRDFSDCTIDGATFSGTVSLTFDDGAVNNTCAMGADGNSIARDPDFTITGARGGSYTVRKTGTFGQKVTRTSAGVFTFENDGIRRSVEYRGKTLADFTTVTTSAIGITGANRSGRVVSGGTLRVTNNLTSVYCDFSPTAVTWDGTCNCPVSGSWSGTCSDSETATVDITGCGAGTLTTPSGSTTTTFERCSAL